MNQRSLLSGRKQRCDSFINQSCVRCSFLVLERGGERPKALHERCIRRNLGVEFAASLRGPHAIECIQPLEVAHGDFYLVGGRRGI